MMLMSNSNISFKKKKKIFSLEIKILIYFFYSSNWVGEKIPTGSESPFRKKISFIYFQYYQTYAYEWPSKSRKGNPIEWERACLCYLICLVAGKIKIKSEIQNEKINTTELI